MTNANVIPGNGLWTVTGTPLGGSASISNAQNAATDVTASVFGVYTLTYTVTDNGCGIPRAHLDQVLEPFFTTKAPGDGTGLGLAICQRIVESLGGTIEVSSRVGRGATFTVFLPTTDASVRTTVG